MPDEHHALNASGHDQHNSLSDCLLCRSVEEGMVPFSTDGVFLYASHGAPESACDKSACQSVTLHVLTSANLVSCPHQPLEAWAMIKEQFTAFCSSLLPWLGPLVYRDGVTPP